MHIVGIVGARNRHSTKHHLFVDNRDIDVARAQTRLAPELLQCLCECIGLQQDAGDDCTIGKGNLADTHGLIVSDNGNLKLVGADV